MPIDKAVRLYDHGVKLLQFCTQKPEAARLSIDKLSLDRKETVLTKPFEKIAEKNSLDETHV